MSKQAREYKARIAAYCVIQGIRPMLGPLFVTMDLCPPDKRLRDGHNYSKVLLDALQGFLYDNDSQVRRLHIELHPLQIVRSGCIKLSCRAITQG